MQLEQRGPFSREQIDHHLREAVIPLRLACVAPDGAPLVLSLWYLWRDGAFWCATSPRAHVVKLLRDEPRCGFEVAGDAPPYRGVRGQGRADLVPEIGGSILEALVDRYVGTRESLFARRLLSRRNDEMAIQISPTNISSWDFARRMS